MSADPSSALNPIILIPARMASERLPGKPLADIGGRPMIVHVLDRCREASVGRVVVACCEAAVRDAVTAAGGEAVMTSPDLPSGSDRVHAALRIVDPEGHHGAVLNVQGDLPTIPPDLIRRALTALDNPAVDIGTLVTAIRDADEARNPNITKAVVGFADADGAGRALYFSRAPVPSGDGPLWHHIGLYAYTRRALDRFVALPPGVLERRERLEQLRALEHGLRIDCLRVSAVPPGVDTPADLDHVRTLLAPGDPALTNRGGGEETNL